MNCFKLLLCLAALVSATYAHGFFKSAPTYAYAYHHQPYSVGTAYLGKALFVSAPQPVLKAVPIIRTIAVAPPPPTIIKTPIFVHAPPPPPPPPTFIKTPVFIHAAPLPLPPPPPPSAVVHSYSGPVAPLLPPTTFLKTVIPHPLPPPPPPPPPPQHFFAFHHHTPVVKSVLPGWHHEEHAPIHPGPALPPHPVSVEANLLKSFHPYGPPATAYGPPATAYGPPSAPAW